MDASNTATLITLMLGALEEAAKVGALLRTVQTEGREPTDAEVAVFLQDDDTARTNLQSAIDEASALVAPAVPT